VEDVLLATLILIGVALLILIVAGGFIAWKVARPDERALARRIGKLRFRDKLAFGRRLMRDPRVPWPAKIIAAAVVVYVASPIDLIPDFIPVLGHVDDLLVALIGGALLLGRFRVTSSKSTYASTKREPRISGNWRQQPDGRTHSRRAEQRPHSFHTLDWRARSATRARVQALQA
jgi:uncharacterized membrane protein YkvA (DUF1232 family)